jgi:hypothetical protein
MIGKANARVLLWVATGGVALGFAASAQAAVCTQDPNVPGYMTCNVGDVTSLNSAFALADADVTKTYNIYLAKGTYPLTSTLNLVQGSINLFGEPGGAFSTVGQYVLDGGGNKQLFHLLAKDANSYPYLNIVGVTVQNGKNANTINGRGGCIFVQNGEVDIQEGIVQNCHAVMAGGIDVDGGGTLLMWTSIVQNNTLNSIVNNTCGGGAFTAGGGITILGAAFIYGSSIVNNQACRGGGIDIEGGYLELQNSTIAKNTGASRGGGLRAVSSTSSFSLLFNTIVENKAGTKACGNSCASDPNGGAGIEFEGFTGGHAELRGNIIVYNTVSFVGNTAVSQLASLRDCDALNSNLQASNSTYFAYSTNLLGVRSTCNLPNWWGIAATTTFSSLATFGLNAMTPAKYSTSVGGSLPAYQPKSTASFLGQYGLHDSTGGNVTRPCIGGDQRGYIRNDESFGLRCDIGSYELNGTPQ